VTAAGRALDQFQQNSMGRFGMDKGDSGSPGSLARRFIYQTHSLFPQLIQGFIDIIDPQSNVLDPLPAGINKFGHGSIWGG
jgi:hypothetical protein